MPFMGAVTFQQTIKRWNMPWVGSAVTNLFVAHNTLAPVYQTAFITAAGHEAARVLLLPGQAGTCACCKSHHTRLQPA